jgi:uncharacterized alkaline shock family protein YloU
MEETRLGRIEVSPLAIASLASQAVLGCYGVVGIASHRRGVDVQIGDDQIAIDLYVVMEYGTRIAMVAQNIQSAVKYTVEKALGVPVAAVNVHVQDLRVSAD